MIVLDDDAARLDVARVITDQYRERLSDQYRERLSTGAAAMPRTTP